MPASLSRKINSSLPWFAKRWNFALVIGALFLLIALITFLLLFEHYKSSTTKALKEDRATANLVSLLLGEHLQKIISIMESYAQRPLLIQAAGGKNAVMAKQHLVDLRKDLHSDESIFLTDSQGTLWDIYPPAPELIGKNFSYRDWYKGVSKNWEPYISEIFQRVIREKDIAFTIGVPVFAEKGEAIALLCNTTRTIELGSLIQRVLLDPGSGITVADRKGQIVYSSRFAYDREINSYPFYFVINEAKGSLNKSVAVDDLLTGRKRYISFAPVAGSGWTVFVSRDSRAILLADSGHYIQLIIITFLLFLLITGFFSYFRKQVLTRQAMDQLRMEKELKTSETRFRELFDRMSSGVAVYRAKDGGEDFIIADINEAGQNITSIYTDFIGKSVCDLFPGVKELGLFDVLQQVWQTGQAAYHPAARYQDDRLMFWAENYVYKLPSGEVVAVFDDITERRLAEERSKQKSRLVKAINLIFSEMMRSTGREDVARTCLAEAQEITGSKFGFIGEITPEGLFSTTNLSDPGSEACQIPETKATKMISNMVIRGIWGDVIHQEKSLIINDPAAYPGSVGLPENHPPLTSFLGVPVKVQGKVTGMIAVANRTSGYTEDNKQNLEAISAAFAEAMSRRDAEEKISQMNYELEWTIAERTKEIVAKNKELERLNHVFVDRELRMRELKERIAELEGK